MSFRYILKFNGWNYDIGIVGFKYYLLAGGRLAENWCHCTTEMSRNGALGPREEREDFCWRLIVLYSAKLHKRIALAM